MLTSRLCAGLRTFKTLASFQSYKSVYSLENLYPNSAINFGGIPQELSDSPPAKFTGVIPVASTKAEVRFHVQSADWIPDDLKPKIIEAYRKRISGSGELIVSSDQSRYQMKNVQLCLDKIRAIIEEVGKPPDPKKQELIDELHNMDKVHAAQKKRLQKKRMQGYTKSMRSGANFD